ncbi:MAG TPA: 5'/3'-nucleotidase SurE [Candidatus Wallbacteria bacterium]|mgnify:FL=1|nr:MAG: 5'-nucleotidase SurE [bacterium ADurb.Bin243]HOD41722.1 5'/3'-nucleotidase SurE [Candidatus Wallbacteria bacterium]HPG56598.1 5'/3'-nucleotidase SurE [Candidatus Wallbacteria bacterium]
MKILLANDDGIHAGGLHNLADALAGGGHDVYVVAPESEKSATSAAITLHNPLRFKEYNSRKAGSARKYFYVNGTPADCVKLGVKVILPELGVRPDLVISGINHGPNIGLDIRYSGTVAAAYEGVFMNYPSIAVSIASYKPDPEYSTASAFIRDNLESLYKKCLQHGNRFLLNINVPSKKPGEIKGHRITRVNNFRYDDSYKKIDAPTSSAYYWLSGKRENIEPACDTDYTSVEEGYISITPLQVDQTDYRALESFREL